MKVASANERRSIVLAAARTCPSRVRRDFRRRAVILTVLGIAMGVGLFLIFGGVRVDPRPTELVVLTTIGIALAAGLVGGTVLRRGASMIGPPRWALIVATLAGVLGMLAWKCSVSALYQGMTGAWVDRPGYRCLRLTLAMAIVPLITGLLARRRTDAAHPATLGATMGATVGLAAMVGVDLWCPVAYLPHLLLGHVLPVGTLAIFGAVVGYRLLSPARRYNVLGMAVDMGGGVTAARPVNAARACPK